MAGWVLMVGVCTQLLLWVDQMRRRTALSAQDTPRATHSHATDSVSFIRTARHKQWLTAPPLIS